MLSARISRRYSEPEGKGAQATTLLATGAAVSASVPPKRTPNRLAWLAPLSVFAKATASVTPASQVGMRCDSSSLPEESPAPWWS